MATKAHLGTMERNKWYLAGARFEAINRQLGGEAEKWADQYPVIRNLLNEKALNRLTDADVTIFRNLFWEHFQARTGTPKDRYHSAHSLTLSVAGNIATGIPSKDILVCHCRRKERFECRDRPRTIVEVNVGSHHQRFINGLSDIQLRLRILQCVVDPNRTLKRGSRWRKEISCRA